MGIDNISLLENDARKLSDRNGWTRSPSICSAGLSVAWNDLRITAKQSHSHLLKKTKYTYKNIIRNVSGAVKSRTFVAILGASGSGKSSLMTILANRNPGDLQMTGKITIGGTPIGKFTRYISGFVYQDDLFLASLTVTEHLNFTAKLRLDKNVTEKARKILINEILTQLGLLKVANNKIGSSKFGGEKVNLSGGERKRLSIATELITDPSLLFCDEPTTGLDAFTALRVIENLKSLVEEKHKTIICSIHQPSEQIFELFDQVILLTSGRIAFSGSPTEAVQFFQSQGYSHNEEQDRAVYLIESLAKESAASTTDKFCNDYEESEYYFKTLEFVDKEMEKDITSSQMIAYHKHVNNPNWFRRLGYVTHRSFLAIVRDNSVQKIRLTQKMILGLLIGLCMANTISWTQSGVQALKGVIFFLVGQNFFPPIHAAASQIPTHLPIFFREYANSTNTPLLFYLSNVLCLLPAFILDPLVFTILVYFMANLQQTAFAIIFTCCMTVLVLNTSAAFGMCVSVAFKKRDIMDAVINPFTTTLIMCSGVFIKLSTIPPILRWIRYVSWFTCSLESLFIVQLYGVNHIQCDPDPSIPCLRNSRDVLASFDFNEDNLWWDVIKVLGFYVFLHLAAYFLLLKKLRSRKL